MIPVMNIAGLLLVVIGDPHRGVARALEKPWLSHQNQVLIPEVFLRRGTIDWATRVCERRFLARHGREPLDGEAGCAAAHVLACEALLSSDATWALVLESDVLILDQEELHRTIGLIMSRLGPCGSRGRVVSLYTEGPLASEKPLSGPSEPLLNVTVPPQGAVAYMIDRQAAESITRAQRRISSVADWPVTTTDVQFSFAKNCAVGHDTIASQSTVAPNVDRSKLLPRRVRIMMWLGLWYLRFWREFNGFPDYYSWVLRPRIHHLRRRLQG